MTFELNAENFAEIWNGSRSWLLNTADRVINTGDRLTIKEFSLQNNSTAASDTFINTGLDYQPPTKGIYSTGRAIYATATNIKAQAKGLINGFQIISIKIDTKTTAEGHGVQYDRGRIQATPPNQSQTSHTGRFRGFEWDVTE